MKLNLQTFATIVTNSATAVQSGTKVSLDIRTGSILRAILEANASIALWMQWLLVRVLRATRASTSADDDLDSWMNDFHFARLPPCCAVGKVTFSRYNVIGSVSVPSGTMVKTSDGSQTFAVSADASNSAWNNLSAGYVLPDGESAFDLPVVATVAGVVGNVQAEAITIIASPIPGVDMASNLLATTGGCDQEDDAAFRQRFVLFINSRSQATLVAVQNAIAAVQQNLSSVIDENSDGNGGFRGGIFQITIDDGTGHPSPMLLAAVYAAVDSVRPIGSVFSVGGPTIQPVVIFANVSILSNANRQAVIRAIEKNVTEFISSLPIGVGLPITRIAQLAYDSDPSVANVFNITINSETADVSVNTRTVVKLTSLLVA